MTYSVIGRCARTHEIGLAIATYSLACGSFAQGAHGGAGVAMTQANVRKGNALLANRLLAMGCSSRAVVQALVQDDVHESFRQIAVMTRDGRVATHTGSRVAGWAGQKAGTDHVVFGNVLVGEHVLDAMEAGFLADPARPLVERLIQSLEHGRDAGGQGSATAHMPERSACVVVTGQKAQAAWDLRVDLHPTAVQELQRVYQAFASYQGYYEDRDDDPSRCPSQLAWEKAQLTEDQLAEFLK
ncbi:DUF1028 domain-containing protein [Xylophilus rhododendri]|uniref:DUF1028 domain-containing protein n=1 Tax=Xylophilus rhododendri TaxID=2697032 RepID=A0A857JAC0_9BURK|nr:DUF1028 domain-containing protein [Xylophilus rhododendri]QHJ00961.1 DUF1028 domain-containing protein [Xylophilus rhododendri]